MIRLSILLAAMLGAAHSPQATTGSPPSDDEWFAREMPALLDLYRELHQHPELSGQEMLTARRVAVELKAACAEVTSEFGGHGVIGVLKNGEGPGVLLRGDMDALPIVEQTALPYASTGARSMPPGAKWAWRTLVVMISTSLHSSACAAIWPLINGAGAARLCS